MPEIKRVTLHPLNPDGSIDENVNLYPKSMVSGLVDDEGNPMPGKGLSTNDYTDEDKNLLDALGRSVELYQYVYAGLGDQQSITLPLIVGSPKNVIREISTKGKPDSASGVYHFDPTAFVIRSLPPFFLFSSGESFDLYQTGLQENITTNKYAYDEVNLSLGKIYRYCRPIILGDLIKAFPSTEWNWSGTAGNGRLSISHLNLETLNITALGWTNDELKVENRTDDLIFRSLSSTNFAIENCKNIEGVTNKATAIAALQDSEILIIFKAVNEWMEDFSQYNLVVADDNYTGSIILPTSDLFTCMQVSYQSLTELVYSKEQTDAKFLSKLDNKGILILPDTIAGEDIYTELADLHYPAIAYANFTEGNDGTVPFTSHTFFINDKRNGSYGYIVISNGAHYWFRVYNDVLTLENMYQIDAPGLRTFEDYTPDFSSEPTGEQLPTYDTAGSDTQAQILRKIIKRGYTYFQNAAGTSLYTGTLVYSGIYDAGRTEAWFFIKDGDTPSLIKVKVAPEDTEYIYRVIPISGSSSSGEKYKHTVVIEVQGQPDTTFWFTYYSSSSTRITKNNIKDLIYNNTDLIKWCFASYQDDVQSNYKNGMIMDCWASNNGYGFQIRPTGTGYSTDIECLNNDPVNDVVTEI